MKFPVSLVALMIAGSVSQAMELGTLELAGNICLNPVGANQVQKGATEDDIIIPLGTYLKKTDAKLGLQRGSCQFAVPIKVTAKERLRVRASQQFFALKLDAQAQKAKLDLEVFKSGARGSVQSAELPNAKATVRTHGYLETEDLLVGQCGEDLILRGNLSALVLGQGTGSVFTKGLKLQVIAEPCP